MIKVSYALTTRPRRRCIMNKRGLRADPWCYPTSIGNYLVSPFSVTTCVMHDMYMSCTIWTYSSGTPFFLKHHEIRYLGILSNAFSRSTKTMCKSLFFSLHCSCSCRNAKTGSVVDIPGLKPNWLSLIFTIYLSRASMIRSQYNTIHASKYCYTYSFFPSTIEYWNSLTRLNSHYQRTTEIQISFNTCRLN